MDFEKELAKKIEVMNTRMEKLVEAQNALIGLGKDLEELGLCDEEGVLSSAHFGLSEAIGVMESVINNIHELV